MKIKNHHSNQNMSEFIEQEKVQIAQSLYNYSPNIFTAKR